MWRKKCQQMTKLRKYILQLTSLNFCWLFLSLKLQIRFYCAIPIIIWNPKHLKKTIKKLRCAIEIGQIHLKEFIYMTGKLFIQVKYFFMQCFNCKKLYLPLYFSNKYLFNKNLCNIHFSITNFLIFNCWFPVRSLEESPEEVEDEEEEVEQIVESPQ